MWLGNLPYFFSFSEKADPLIGLSVLLFCRPAFLFLCPISALLLPLSALHPCLYVEIVGSEVSPDWWGGGTDDAWGTGDLSVCTGAEYASCLHPNLSSSFPCTPPPLLCLCSPRLMPCPSLPLPHPPLWVLLALALTLTLIMCGRSQNEASWKSESLNASCDANTNASRKSSSVEFWLAVMRDPLLQFHVSPSFFQTDHIPSSHISLAFTIINPFTHSRPGSGPLTLL